MSEPQQIINVGEVANDGTGESLRDAFNAVNNNFANVWAQGPVDTQVIISNNRVSTNETNLDLELAGNGIGNIAVASTTVPTIDSVYDLGSPSRYFDTTYSRYFYGNGRFLTGISGGSGGGATVTFAATPPFVANVGDIWIQSTTGTQYLYFNDNTSNQWAEMEAYQSFSYNAGGNSDTGNIGFVDDAIYDLNGMIIENADLSHGATAAMIIPSNGNSTNPLQINNTYGNIQIMTGTDPGHLKTWIFDSSGTLNSPGVVKTAVFTVDTLPSASTVGAGARAFVSDSITNTFNSNVGNGGANSIPVFSDGTSWRVG
jgi:hypothetical protein